MKRILNLLFAGAFLFVFSVMAHAGSQPKFGIAPTIRAPLELINTGIALAQYRVRNNTTIYRRLTMKPIKGIEVLASGCSLVFELAPGKSCLLNLRLTGSLMGAGVLGGPEICKTNIGNDNPSSFLCSQPAQENILNVKIIATPRATISVTPTVVKFVENGSGSVTVTNNSAGPAENIMAHIPVGSPIRVLSSTCPRFLARQASCRITFTSTTTARATVRIQGSNTNRVNVAVSVSESLISISPTALTFAVNDTGTVTVTNVSAFAALNVGATIPATSSISVVNSTCPTSLASGASCTIEFTATAQEQTAVLIEGSNTNSEVLTITTGGQLTLSPFRAIITADGTSAQTLITVTNTSSVSTAINVSADLPASWGANVVQDSSDCITIAPGGSCTLAFSSAFAVFVPEVGIPVSGNNTEAPAPTFGLAFFTDGGLVYDVDINDNIFIVMDTELSTGSWGSFGVVTGANSTTDGDQNTQDMVTAGNAGAGLACSNLVLNGFNDWYLPAILQLQAIYTNLNLLGFGNFLNTVYWSSTEDTATNAFVTDFFNGTTLSISKNSVGSIRCARVTASV